MHYPLVWPQLPFGWPSVLRPSFLPVPFRTNRICLESPKRDRWRKLFPIPSGGMRSNKHLLLTVPAARGICFRIAASAANLPRSRAGGREPEAAKQPETAEELEGLRRPTGRRRPSIA